MIITSPLVTWIRLIGYVVGMAAAIALAGQLLATEHRLSNALAGLLIGWGLNAIIMASLLLYQWTVGDYPEWRPLALTVNAVVVGAGPAVMWYALNKWGDGER